MEEPVPVVCFMRIGSVIRRLPAVFAVAGIWFLSSQSALPRPKGLLGFDKFQHFLAWFFLAGTFGMWFSRTSWEARPRRAFALTLAAASAYGMVDEIHQFFVPGRSCHVMDWAADTLGAIAGAALFLLIANRLRRSGGPEGGEGNR